ncbi:flagellar hook-length control protein FliK [Vibrio bivalvicida]|uniref:Flagellar hook-length control protein FliK n=1 Tax=Vibrio bivalvicida TaxID=1276888 RepID=A0A177XWI8_9VIBR|nr:flagellar hook-length control protein FliK [Vibrio bivalvicida]OAJ92951.1 flagellar hook-length control protein FliK [Vibrio bivalvicida]
MNINLSSVSESPKVTKATTEGEGATSESSESGGFFSKLAALIKGESDSEGKVDKSESTTKLEGEDVAVEDGESEPISVKASATEGQSTDELLESDDAESVKSVTSDIEGNAKEAKKTEVSNTTDVASIDSNKAASQSAEKIVSENDEVLQRLDHSSKALQPKDGKPLPQDNSAPRLADAPITENDKQAAVLVSTDGGKEVEGDEVQQVTSVNSNQKPSSTRSDAPQLTDSGQEAQKVIVRSVEGETVAVPASAERFMQQKDVETNEQLKAELQTKNHAVSASSAAALSQQDTVEFVDGSTKPQLDSQPFQTEVASTTVSQFATAAESPDTDDSESNVVEGAALVAGSAVLGAAAVTTAAAAEKGTQEVSKLAVDAETSAQALAVAADAQSDSELEPSIAAATVVAGAIPWAASSEGQVKDDAALKADSTPRTQQAPVAQSVHQALAHQQSQAQLAQAVQQQVSTATIPTDLAATQIQQMAAAPNAAIAQDQAMLKAVMGAKVAGTLGKVATNKDGSQQGTETNTGFAQQLAQASGQQGSGSLGQVRAEQAAQAPLQLNRELAGEQVAERVQMMMSKNLKNIDIRLDPPELGRMQIRMHMNGDATTVHFTVANQQARDVIEQSMPRLREMLAQQGVQLGDSSVQQQASGQQQRRYADNGQGNNGQGNGNLGPSGEENLEPDINLDLNVAAKSDGISYYA